MTIHYKKIQYKKCSNHNHGWFRILREANDGQEYARMKFTHRLARRTARIHYKLFDYDDCHTGRMFGGKLRSWKRHSKCPHQWERHELPVHEPACEYLYGVAFSPLLDHNRKWIMECLRQKTTCIFNCHNDAPLEFALDKLFEAGVCTVHDLGQGYREVTLKKQINHIHGSAPEENHPRKKVNIT